MDVGTEIYASASLELAPSEFAPALAQGDATLLVRNVSDDSLLEPCPISRLDITPSPRSTGMGPLRSQRRRRSRSSHATTWRAGIMTSALPRGHLARRARHGTFIEADVVERLCAKVVASSSFTVASTATFRRIASMDVSPLSPRCSLPVEPSASSTGAGNVPALRRTTHCPRQNDTMVTRRLDDG